MGWHDYLFFFVVCHSVPRSKHNNAASLHVTSSCVATADNSRESRRTEHQPENKPRLSRSFFVKQAAAADIMFSSEARSNAPALLFQLIKRRALQVVCFTSKQLLTSAWMTNQRHSWMNRVFFKTIILLYWRTTAYKLMGDTNKASVLAGS